MLIFIFTFLFPFFYYLFLQIHPSYSQKTLILHVITCTHTHTFIIKTDTHTHTSLPIFYNFFLISLTQNLKRSVLRILIFFGKISMEYFEMSLRSKIPFYLILNEDNACFCLYVPWRKVKTILITDVLGPKICLHLLIVINLTHP